VSQVNCNAFTVINKIKEISWSHEGYAYQKINRILSFNMGNTNLIPCLVEIGGWVQISVLTKLYFKEKLEKGHFLEQTLDKYLEDKTYYCNAVC
jgi:hypothetical protein